MAMSTLLGRFCLSEIDARHATGLFTVQGELQDLPGRFGQIFLIAATKNDGLPTYVCRSCRDKAFSVEKLQDLHRLPRESLNKLGHGQDSRKRSKETSSGPGVSPHTVAVRPPAKRANMLGKKPFQEGNSTVCTYMNNIIRKKTLTRNTEIMVGTGNHFQTHLTSSLGPSALRPVPSLEYWPLTRVKRTPLATLDINNILRGHSCDAGNKFEVYYRVHIQRG